MTAQILLSLSILVGLHELGHLLAAKAFGMRVEQYSIGFPPKLFGIKYGETEYSLGAIPLGGFVKISGMIDESLDVKSLSEEPKEWEFRAKPAWQRLIVMMGGIVVNVITGMLIFIMVVYFTGDSYISAEEVNKKGIVALELGQELGLKTGDRIIKINGEDYDRYSDIQSASVLLADNSYYTVDRGGEIVDIPIPADFIERLSEKDARNRFITPIADVRIFSVKEGSVADEIGIQEGDIIKGINDLEVEYYKFDQFQEVKEANKGKEVTLHLERDGVPLKLQALVPYDGVIGFTSSSDIDYSTKEYTFGESLAEGTNRAFMAVYVNAKALGKVFKGEVSASKSLSGPIGIAKIFGGTWNWYRFWNITGLLSMVLAFMNFLPIPALDGGHVMFLTYEMVSGKKPSDKFLEGAQKVGMIMILGLMAFVIFNDILKLDFIKNLFG